MELLFWGLTLGVLGKVVLGLTVVSVHSKIIKEHRIDKKVLREMQREKNFALIGITLIIVGYLFELAHFEYLVF